MPKEFILPNPTLSHILDCAKRGEFLKPSREWVKAQPRGWRLIDSRSDICRCVQKSLETLDFSFSRWTRDLEYVPVNSAKILFEEILSVNDEGLILGRKIYKVTEIEPDTLALLIKIKEWIEK